MIEDKEPKYCTTVARKDKNDSAYDQRTDVQNVHKSMH